MSHKDVRIALGQRLREARRSAGLSQTEVAQRFGWGQNLVSRHERGLYWPTYTQIHQYAEVFDWPQETINEFLDVDPRAARNVVVAHARKEYASLIAAVADQLHSKAEKRTVNKTLADVVRARYGLTVAEMSEKSNARRSGS